MHLLGFLCDKRCEKPKRYDHSQIIKVQEKKTYDRFGERSLNDIIYNNR